MKKAIILHGTLGSPEGNWFPWLAITLAERGIEAWIPNLPRPEQPSLVSWSQYVHENCPFDIDEKTLIVGHSSGAILSLILAQQSKRTLGGVAAVSVFYDNSLHWEPNNSLFDVAFEYDAIKKNVQKLLFIHSDNDPYVPLEQAKFVTDNCAAELIVIRGQGHFNLEMSESYREFPKLLELLEERRML